MRLSWRLQCWLPGLLNATRPADASPVATLTPDLLKGILAVAEELVVEGCHIISLGRFNFGSGSNELDHPYCVELRELMSAFLRRVYGLELAAFLPM